MTALSVAAVALSGCGLFSSAPDASPIPVPPSASPSSSASAGPAEVDLSRFADQQVTWSNCGGTAECAVVKVPMDYTNPDGRTLDLAVTRIPATGESLGPLFVNPGGPGGSAFDYAKAADAVVSPQVRERFDVVGVDPRGVAHSSPISCLTDDELDALLAVDGTPDSAADIAEAVDASADVLAGCTREDAELLPFLGTVNAARDFDIVRAVLGAPTMSYLGKSYGTFLGAAYAELFPQRVGRMVLDGVLSPTASMVEVTHDQAVSFEKQVREFAAYCAGHDDCPFDGNGEQVLAALHAWLASLDANPLAGDDRPLNEALATYAVLSYLYFPGSDYIRLLGALQSAVDDGDPEPMLALLDARISRGPDGRYLDNSSDAFYAISCTDRPFDGTVADVEALAQEWAVDAPTFGPGLAWGVLPCAGWPASERLPSITATGSGPILVVGTLQDSATPVHWARELAADLDNGHLLLWDGSNHTAYREGSPCVDAAVNDFLLTGTPPPAGTICD